MSGIDISSLDIPSRIDKPEPGKGVYSFIHRGIKLDRDNACLKIFRHPVTDPDNFYWGLTSEKGSNIIEATKIQNLYAFAGLAPRIYSLQLMENKGQKYYVQEIEDLGEHKFDATDEEVHVMNDKLKEFAKNNEIEFFDDGRSKNLIKGKWVDFQGYKFKPSYQQKLREKVDTVCNWHPPASYQPIPLLNLRGRRNNEYRVKQMQLDKIDFKGKTVVDFGCSAGWFCNYASEKGAKRIVGIDYFGRAGVARELSNYLGVFNIDYYEVDLLKTNYEELVKLTGFNSFNIAFYFSMSYHVGMSQYIFDLAKELLIYEGNSRANDQQYEDLIRKNFKEVTKVGETTDLNPRRILWAIK